MIDVPTLDKVANGTEDDAPEFESPPATLSTNQSDAAVETAELWPRAPSTCVA